MRFHGEWLFVSPSIVVFVSLQKIFHLSVSRSSFSSLFPHTITHIQTSFCFQETSDLFGLLFRDLRVCVVVVGGAGGRFSVVVAILFAKMVFQSVGNSYHSVFLHHNRCTT